MFIFDTKHVLVGGTALSKIKFNVNLKTKTILNEWNWVLWPGYPRYSQYCIAVVGQGTWQPLGLPNGVLFIEIKYETGKDTNYLFKLHAYS